MTKRLTKDAPDTGETQGLIPATVEEANVAIAILQKRRQATSHDICRNGEIESAKHWRNVLASAEQTLAAEGQHEDTLLLMRERAEEARGALDRLSEDIALLPEMARLDGLRLKLEVRRDREARFGSVDASPIHVSLPEWFGADMGGYRLEEGFPPEVVALFTRLSSTVDPVAKKLEAEFTDVAAAGAALGDLVKPIDPAALATLRAKRLALVAALKVYVTTMAAAYSELVSSDVSGMVLKFNGAVATEATQIAAGVEKKALEAGLGPEDARAAAQDAPAVRAAWGKTCAASVATAEEGYARMMIRRSESARSILEAEIAALV